MGIFKDYQSTPSEVMKNMIWVTLFLLAGCDSNVIGGKNSTIAPDNKIVLQCSGVRSLTRETSSYLIKIDPSNHLQQSMSYYDESEKRFVSPCIDKFPRCWVEVSSDLIKENGVMIDKDKDNKVILHQLTTINRRTGEMHIVLKSPVLDEIPVFDGECIKGEIPQEQAQKF